MKSFTKKIRVLFYIFISICLLILCTRKNSNNPAAPDDKIEAPTLISPADSSLLSESRPTFVWNKVDGCESYELIVDDSASFSSPVIDNNNISKTSYKSDSLADGLYYWKVRARDAAGNWGQYSEVRSFTIDTQGPPAPSLISPDDTATLNDNTPSFDWTDVAGAAQYELMVDNSSSFDSPEIHRTNLAASSYTAASSLADGLYYWKVRARDAAGNWGQYSEVRSFTIDTQGPPAPSLISPDDMATLNDNTPSFDWTDVAEAVQYELMVDNSISFNDPEIHKSDLTISEFTAASSIPDGGYYWKVRAMDNKGRWGEWSDVWRFIISSFDPSTIQMVYVEGGTFQMGSTDGDPDERPVHTVTLNSFYISKYEITNSQFAKFLNSVSAEPDGSRGGVMYIEMSDPDCQIEYKWGTFVSKSGFENYPVREVTWYGAKDFCEWAGGRLPTEAEWEFAARGGNLSNGYIYAGSNNPDEVAWYLGNSGGDTHQVGLKLPNELGIYDMSGNVCEWCWDWYDGSYYSVSPENNPQGPTSSPWDVKVKRGGAWNHWEEHLRTTDRENTFQERTCKYLGIRLCK